MVAVMWCGSKSQRGDWPSHYYRIKLQSMKQPWLLETYREHKNALVLGSIAFTQIPLTLPHLPIVVKKITKSIIIIVSCSGP